MADLQAFDIFPYIKKVTGISHTTCTEVKLPSDCNQVIVFSDAEAFKLGQNDQVAGNAITADHMPVAINSYFTVKIGKGRNRADSLFLQMTSGTNYVYVMLQEVI